MAQRTPLTLHCNQCRTVLASSDSLMLATIPPTQSHVAIRKEHEDEAYETVRKIPNPDPKKSTFCPYKILCKQCGVQVGTVSVVEGSTLICFKIEGIHFKRGYQEIKGKKLKNIKEKLIQHGLQVVNVSHVRQAALQSASRETERPSEPLVYCDTNLSNEEILSLTKDVPRDYQRELFLFAMRGNTLVYLPTGSGKTLIAAMVVSCMKKLNPKKLMVFLTDRIPLVYQQSDYIKSQVPDLRVEILAGDIGRFPGDKSRWMATVQALSENKVDLLVMTHQILLNLMADDCPVVRMSDISVIVFDEAHHCLGNHCYNQVMRDFYKVTPDRLKPLVLALTASPAGALTPQDTTTRLEELLSNLCSSARMPMYSKDLELYWNRPETSYKVVPLNAKQQCLQSLVESYLISLQQVVETAAGCPRALDGLRVLIPNYRGALRKLIERCYGDKGRVKGLALGEHAMHMLSVIEVNNILGCEYAVQCLEDCLKQLQHGPSPMEQLKKKLIGSSEVLLRLQASITSLKCASVLFSSSDRYQYLLQELLQFVHQVKKDNSSRGIIFVKMRTTAYKLCERLRKAPGLSEHLNPAFFVGHGRGSDGMDWRGEQEEILKKFRSGEVKLLVSTSVLEEGLDVPVCNLVIRFDSALTLRALVQSRGRASRRPDSKFVVICSDAKEQTEAFDVIRKERNMDQAMRLQQRSLASLTQALSFGCQMKKLASCETVEAANETCTEEEPLAEDDFMANECSVETRTINVRAESLASGGSKKKKKKFIPDVKITIHNVSAEEGSNEIGLLGDYFENYFEVKSFKSENREVAYGSGSSRVLQFQIEPLENQTFKSKDEFFTHVVESWCYRPRSVHAQLSEKLWLHRVESSNRKYSKPVLVFKANAMCLGYFLNQAQFHTHWPCMRTSTCKLENIRVAFEHDLKEMRIFFTIPKRFNQWKADFFKFQVHYSELQAFLLVDKPRSRSTHDVFVSLRHPPRMFKAKSFIKKDEDDENDFEDWYFDDNEYDFDYDRDYFGEFSSESEEDEDINRNSNVVGAQGSEDAETESLLTSSDVASIENVVNWERVTEVEDSGEALGLCCVYNFSIPDSAWAEVKEVLKSIAKFDKKTFYASVRKSTKRLPEVDIPRELPFDVKYAAQCVLHLYPFVRGRVTRKFASLLRKKPEKLTLAALERLGTALERNPFCDAESKLESLLDAVDLKPTGIPKQLLPAHCAMIKRLVITPTRLLFYTPEIMSKNRVLRKFNTDQFLCVNIRDEDFSRLSAAGGGIDAVLARVKGVLDSEVVAGGDWFLYLGSSNSQLRNHGCWFVRPSPHPDAIREWMGDFSAIRCVATYMARMGQCFSTSMDAVGISVEEGTFSTMDEDIETPSGDYCFSDGVGRISESLVRQVARKIGKNIVPSAIQIRFAGCKGVLALDPRLSENTASFRPSMRKFESPHRRLEVLQTSRAQAVFLNHQLIMLLSNLGVPDDVFIHLQRDMLDKLAGMLVDEGLAAQQMTSGAKTSIAYTSLSEAGIPLTTESFFKSLLVALYKDRIQNLLTRARILLPPQKARLMIGVMDETQTLQHGQVFVQYSAMSQDPDREGEFSKTTKLVLTGPVVVTRNPCLHPGDIRQLTAVHASQLGHLVDCVVFPSRGPRPHPSEMAGGDLDGDLYFVCWNEDLLLKRPQFEPMNYEAPPKKEVSGTITVHHMTDFVAEYIRFDQLGVIDNAHKAHADSRQGGVESKICLELAELHSLAVDAPKTGKWPEMPKEAKVVEFPDFMMKLDKPSYPSDKVLGKLWRECRAFKDSMAQEGPTRKPRVAPDLLVPNFQRYLEEAKELYGEYSGQLRTLMNLYGIESEAELLSGCFRKLHNRLGREKTEIAEIVSRVLGTIRATFRVKFFEEFELDETRKARKEISEEMQQKASAWYYVAYTHELVTSANESVSETPDKQFLSFPWVVDDVMLSIRQRKPFQNQEIQGVVTSVSQTAVKVFNEERDSLLDHFSSRLQKKNFISQRIQEVIPGLTVALFGSSATLLFRPDSDLDLCVLNPKVIARQRELGREEQIALLKRLHPVMKKMFKHARLVETARIPVIACENPIKRSGALGKVAGDLTASWDGLLKAIVLSQYTKSYPGLLPVLRLLLNWGHVTGLSGHGKDAGIKSNLLVFLLLVFCVSKRLVKNFDLDAVWSQCYHISTGHMNDAIFIQEWEAVMASLHSAGSSHVTESQSSSSLAIGDSDIGEILLTFFQAYNTTVETTIPETFATLLGVRKLAELLDPEHLRLLQEHMQRAFHLLALYGDVEVLLTLTASEVDRVIFLSEALSYTISGSERHNAYELSRKTGARVTIRPRVPGSGMGLILQAIGTEAAVASVERALNAMATQAVRNRAAVMSVCFIKEAKHMLFEGCLSDDDHVTLVPYYGNHHSTHDSLALYVPMLANPRSGLSRIGAAYTRHEFLTFQEKFLTQVQVIERDFVPSIHGDMEFAIHFGRVYVLNVPKSFTEDTESPTVSVFQTNLQRGYKPRPEVLSSPLGKKRPGKSYYSSPRGKGQRNNYRKQKMEQLGEDGKKIPREKASRSSFFTVVSSDEKLASFLTQRGFAEAETTESYVVEIHTDHEFCVKLDKDLKFVEMMFPKLRWCAVDVKRAWKEKPGDHDVTELDGVETDVRFALKTRRALPPDDIRGTSYEQYRDVLQPQLHPRPSRSPFVVKQDLWKDVALVRHKKSRIYRLDPLLVAGLQSDFKKSLSIHLSEVTEYSRPTKHASAFSKVFTRCEVACKPGLPYSWSNTESWEKLLRDVWAFAFAFASFSSE